MIKDLQVFSLYRLSTYQKSNIIPQNRHCEYSCSETVTEKKSIVPMHIFLGVQEKNILMTCKKEIKMFE